MYGSTKRYGHERGLSCNFRQWRAKSHCRFLHGYALAVTLDFEADTLDARNWVQDFGSLKPIKQWLDSTFDHKLLIADDDPERDTLWRLGGYGEGRPANPVAQVVFVPATGCEAFAELIGRHVVAWLERCDVPRLDVDGSACEPVRLARCTVHEHEGNSAWWSP